MQSPQQTSELVPTRFVWPYGGRQVGDESRRLVSHPPAQARRWLSVLCHLTRPLYHPGPGARVRFLYQLADTHTHGA